MYKNLSTKDLSDTPAQSQHYENFMRELRAKVQVDDNDRTNWKMKMLVASNQRLGIKRITAYPYPGAPDIPMPETDKLIKKALPNLVLSAWSPKKKCIVSVKQGVDSVPYEQQQKKAEAGLNMYLNSPEIGLFHKLMIAADNLKHYGHCIFRVFEEFRCRYIHKEIAVKDYPEQVISELKRATKSELLDFIAQRYGLDLEDDDERAIADDVYQQFKSGADVIEFELPVINSYPQIEVVDPLRLIVPAHTTDINQAERVTYEYYLSRWQLEQYMDQGTFLERDLETLKKSAGKPGHDMVEMNKGRNEGISDNTSAQDLFRIHEICCWYKGENDKRARRKVLTFLADAVGEDALLQDIDFPYEFDGWFYEKHDNELKDTRYFSSRGIPEQVRAMQEVLERSINNMLIRDEYNNTPLYEVLDTSEILDAHVSLTPGSRLPVKALGQEIAPVNRMVAPDVSSERIMALIKAYTEEYLAVSDQLFRNATNAGGGKTLGEIQVGIQQNSGSLNLEIISWNETLSKVYDKMFRILAERLGDSIVIDGQEITREDFNFPAEVRSNGTVEISNSDLATQKAWMRLAAIMNPAMAEIVDAEDRYRALRDWLEKDGVKDPDQFCTHPAEILKTQLAQMQQQAAQMQQQMMMQGEVLKQQQKDAVSMEKKEKESQAKVEAADEMAGQVGMAMEGVGSALLAGSG